MSNIDAINSIEEYPIQIPNETDKDNTPIIIDNENDNKKEDKNENNEKNKNTSRNYKDILQKLVTSGKHKEILKALESDTNKLSNSDFSHYLTMLHEYTNELTGEQLVGFFNYLQDNGYPVGEILIDKLTGKIYTFKAPTSQKLISDLIKEYKRSKKITS